MSRAVARRTVGWTARALVAVALALLALATDPRPASSAPAPAAATAPPDGPGERVDYPAIRPGIAVDPARDAGSHPAYRTEWWYVTGWLEGAGGAPLGFQITFFRTRPATDPRNPSAFAATQLLIAHAALTPGAGPGAWRAERIARAGLGLARASTERTAVSIDDWVLEATGGGALHARASGTGAAGVEGGFDLTLVPAAAPLVHGVQGYSQKGPAAGAASGYYSLPQLAVSGTATVGGRPVAVRGRAWLDHEWSSAYLEAGARGWDWIGINLDDGGAAMAFRIRAADGTDRWAGATWRDAAGVTRTYGPGAVRFVPGRTWRSPRTGTDYPVAYTVTIGPHVLDLAPLVDDQEADTRATTGAVYWEGAVTARAADGAGGRGYLELTGYGAPLMLP